MGKQSRAWRPNRIIPVSDIEASLIAYNIQASGGDYSEYCSYVLWVHQLCGCARRAHADACTPYCTGQYEGKVRIKGEVRSTLLREKTSLRKLPGSRQTQRSCFRVRLTDLVAAGVELPGAVPEAVCIKDVIGRIVSFLVLPNSGAGQAVPTDRVLARVRLYAPVPLREMRTAAAAVETELWNHNYTFINHQHFTTHILPAQLIGALVVVMPHVQRSIAKLGYCLVLQES